MIRPDTVTVGLVELLRSRHDDGHPPLRIILGRDELTVLRADGSELSETEASHVRGLMAAHSEASL